MSPPVFFMFCKAFTEWMAKMREHWVRSPGPSPLLLPVHAEFRLHLEIHSERFIIPLLFSVRLSLKPEPTNKMARYPF